MPIKVNLAAVLAQRNVKSKELAEYIGITEANLSLLRQGKVKGMRFDTLDAICRYLACQPGDILTYEPDNETAATPEP
ncbi:putative transcriptional regulator [Pseudoxanthobacter soli DSM 19599]|uniref:Putative transcriptional regulator n=1 Tax=Pseudoxanthobacter soli DSM 19599 TaxID=1123029 RepID=A0A1M7ZMA7_9HYPH|nr:helix-turn-helix transcriptional regulator [Pseudoxanthobacter soli]SHO66038.1 putative transcriptional regulator [Pseudoxanthobacter soli DSM 19599]